MSTFIKYAVLDSATAVAAAVAKTIAIVSLLGLGGCSHLKPVPANPEAGLEQVQTTAPVTSEVITLADVKSFKPGADVLESQILDPELENIPEDMEEAVEKWVEYFQNRGRPFMERYLVRSTRYMGLMRKILRDNKMPEDLIYVALIESGFSPRVTSRAGAVGYWQFIRATGRRYGLKINQFVDERRDPVLSTQAAARYLKDLYGEFESWQLAMASYNVGEGRIRREMNKHPSQDFWDLARRKRIPRETREYVPKYFAAKLIAKNPEQFGFLDTEYQPPIEFEVIEIDKNINLRKFAEGLSLSYEELKQLNPKYRGEIAPVDKVDVVRIPVGMLEAAKVAVVGSAVERVEFVADQGETLMHRVRSGDTLSTIARRYRVSMAEIRDLNHLSKKGMLRVGTRIFVPDRGVDSAIAGMSAQFKLTGKPARNNALIESKVKNTKTPRITMDDSVRKLLSSASKNGASRNERRMSSVNDGDGDVHIVKPGENLSTIARRYKVSIDSIRKVNSLSRKSILRVGLRLKIPDANAT